MSNACPSNGTSTSDAAAESMGSIADRQREAVLAAVASAREGLTREEVEGVTRLKGNSVRPRVWELMREGRVVEAAGVTRPTRSGRAARVLIVAPF